MVADFLVVLFSIGFLLIFVFSIFNLKKLYHERQALIKKRKERNERFATFDKHFDGKEFFVKEAGFDNDFFASIEEEI